MDPVADDAACSITDFELHRLHYTYSMMDLESFREDYRYIFRNVGANKRSVVPLLWRWREVQANMSVLDACNVNLVYLPSEITRLATRLFLARTLEQGMSKTPLAQTAQSRKKLEKAIQSVDRALAFESQMKDRVEAYEQVHELSSAFPNVEEFRHATMFLAFLSEFYLPFAVLQKPCEPGEFVFVRHGVDLYTPMVQPRPLIWPHLKSKNIGTWDILWFFLRGRLNYKVPIALDAFKQANARSVHCRIAIPPGLRVEPPLKLEPSRVFNDQAISSLTSRDSSNVYFYLERKEIDSADKNRSNVIAKRMEDVKRSDAAMRRRRSMFPKLRISPVLSGIWERSIADRLENARKVRLDMKVTLGVARGVTSLMCLLWFSALTTVVIAGLGMLDLDRFLTLMGIVLLVVLSIGVFAIDKHILREYVSAHVVSAVAVSVEAFLLASLL